MQMKCPVDPLDVVFIKGYDNLVQKYDPPADIEFALFAKRCMQRNGLPTNIEEATLLYVEILHEVENKI